MLVVFGIAACGGTSESASQSSPVQITLQSLASGTNKKAAGDNLIHLDQAWQTWSGQSVGVTYDPLTNSLLLPASQPGIDLVLAMQRYETSLAAGTEYTLSVTASDNQAAAMLFLFDTVGAIVLVPGLTNTLATARTGQTLTFTAPANVVGFYLQVQNRWQNPDASNLSAQLIDGSEPATEPGVVNPG